MARDLHNNKLTGPEFDADCLQVNDFIAIPDNAYSREQVPLMEKSILGKLEWYLTVPTPYVFLVRYIKPLVPSDPEMENMCPFRTETLKHYTGYSEVQLRDCAKPLVSYHTAFPEKKKNSDIYGLWKNKSLSDFGMATQCVSPTRINDHYLTNVLLKINSKGAALLDFYSTTNGQKPSQIVVFRDGVSESQFSQVLDNELDQMIKAYQHLREENIPKFTVIVAQKLFQAGGVPENFPLGTVVDTKIVHPRNYYLYMCAQAGLIVPKEYYFNLCSMLNLLWGLCAQLVANGQLVAEKTAKKDGLITNIDATDVDDELAAVEYVRELQLVGICRMLIACKYEEIWAPEVNDFIAISDNAYSRKQGLLMEK
ncbi:hypothetical protein POM88_040834 [Heracleum sosnowskyi]|uniref:Piwi domain-containing protein n=1 Tax=Heracleum sosnowskyi TaxID=360622 RepID=A0AAD8HER2_9APIA|nr:hypothetical protein POM88_040834 [Heracleum sosnowskyi]